MEERWTGRDALAIGTAGLLVLAWYGAFVAIALLEHTTFGASWSRFGPFCAGAGALIGLSARLAGKRRWRVGIPLLGALGLAGLGLCALAALGPGQVPGLGLGVALGSLLAGPAVLALPTGPGGAGSTSPTARRGGVAEGYLWITVLGLLAVAVVAYSGPRAVHLWRVTRVRHDVLASVEALLRADLLARAAPVVWRSNPCGSWPSAPDFVADAAVRGTDVRVCLRSAEVTREFGVRGKAEGLRLRPLCVSVPQPRWLNSIEACDPRVVQPILLAAGLRPEFVAGYTATGSITCRGVIYRLVPNQGFARANAPSSRQSSTVGPTAVYAVLEGRGLRR